MDDSIKCECGSSKFWFLGYYVRCVDCFNEYKQVTTGRKKIKELWLRRFNKEEHKYGNNWEQVH